MKSIVFSVILIMFLSGSLFAYVVTFNVLDGNTQQPVAMAKIVIKGGGETYPRILSWPTMQSIDNVNGVCTVTVEVDGFDDKSMVYNIGKDQTINIYMGVDGAIFYYGSGKRKYSLTVFPNPVRGNTRIAYSLGHRSRIKFDLYSSAGKNVKSVKPQINSPGFHEFDLDMSRFACGIYILRIWLGDKRFVTRITKQK
jgi:hypothetical protein